MSGKLKQSFEIVVNQIDLMNQRIDMLSEKRVIRQTLDRSSSFGEEDVTLSNENELIKTYFILPPHSKVVFKELVIGDGLRGVKNFIIRYYNPDDEEDEDFNFSTNNQGIYKANTTLTINSTNQEKNVDLVLMNKGDNWLVPRNCFIGVLYEIEPIS